MNTQEQLRFDVFSAAQMRCDQKYNYEFTMYENALNTGETHTAPVYPSIEEILDDAKTIYDFVNNKG
jgi:hypothetical protein